WVSEKTREKIKDLLHRDHIKADTRLILTNAIYFKGKWEKEFPQAGTSDEDWHGPHGADKVPMMHQKSGYLYHEDADVQALDLPYKGGQLSMLIVLPRKQDVLAAVENRWARPETAEQVTARLKHEQTVIVSLPRFKLETSFQLKPVLCALGAELTFTGEADF